MKGEGPRDDCEECLDGFVIGETLMCDCPLLKGLAAKVKVFVENTDLLEARWVEMLGDMKQALHDVREPLRTVTNFSKLTEDAIGDGDFEAAREHAGKASVASVVLREMLVSLAEVMSFGEGKSDGSNRSEFNLSEVIEEAIKIVKPNGENCQVVVDGEMPSMVGDRQRWMRVFQNLFSNSMKYNESDECLIEVWSDGNVIFVKDNGMGIPEDKWNVVFELFLRLRDRSHMASGTGMGLYMAKRFVEWDGGNLSILSSGPDGTVFRIETPVA